MRRGLQGLVVALVLRVVHAAIAELYRFDTRVRDELKRMPEGMSYAVHAAAGGPSLYVQWEGGVLSRVSRPERPSCSLQIKTMPLAFRLFVGQMGLAQAYARHAFTLQGDIGDVMRLARLVNLVEAYLFPQFVTRRILTDVPKTQVSPLRVYAHMAFGFMTGRYRLREPR